MKKAFTLVELLVSIALMSVILVATSNIFSVALSNYKIQSETGYLQKEINFTLDTIGKDIKLATGAPTTYDTFVRSADTLIISLPTVNENDDFVYSGTEVLKDYFVYYLDGSRLKKKVYANSQSRRKSQDSILLNDVSVFSVVYSPNDFPTQISTLVNLNKNIGKKTIHLEGSKTANLRNKQ